MKNMTTLGAVLTAVCVASTASADMVTYTDTFGSPNPPGETPPFTANLMFNQFNTSLGTLTGIQIVLNTAELATVQIYNIGAPMQSFANATATVPISLSAPMGVTTSVMGVAGPISGITTMTGVNSYTGVTGSQSTTITVPVGDFGAYEGSSSSPYTISATGLGGIYSGSGPAGTLFFGGSVSANGSVEVIYDYTPAVPDSAVTLSMISGVFGMLAVSRKLRSAKI